MKTSKDLPSVGVMPHSSMMMTPEEYQKMRESIAPGSSTASQIKVSILLGVHLRTIQRRESGFIPVSKEAEMAIRSLAAEQHARRQKISQAARSGKAR